MKPISLLAALLLVGGCASSSDMQKLQNQVSELQEELAGLKRTTAAKDEIQTVNQRIAAQTQELLRSNATLVAKVDGMDERIQNLQGTIEQTNYRVDQLAAQVTQNQRDVEQFRTSAAVVAPGTAPASEIVVQPPPTGPAPTAETYQSAYRDYQRGNFDLAIAGFREFLEGPQNDLSDNASYWIGESLFSQKKYADAIQQFDEVITRYPQSDKVPGALLKKGYAYISLGERAQGIVQLQYVLHEHPGSQEAALARQRLKQLGVETR